MAYRGGKGNIRHERHEPLYIFPLRVCFLSFLATFHLEKKKSSSLERTNQRPSTRSPFVAGCTRQHAHTWDWLQNPDRITAMCMQLAHLFFSISPCRTSALEFAICFFFKFRFRLIPTIIACLESVLCYLGHKQRAWATTMVSFELGFRLDV